jgi:DNA-binding transcriptional regulator YiaG
MKKKKITHLGQGLLKGLKEVIAFENKKMDLRSTFIEIPGIPPEFTRLQIKQIREEILKVSQPLFAKILGVSDGAVKSWELGTNTPNGSSARLIQMAQKDPEKFKEIILEITG